MFPVILVSDFGVWPARSQFYYFFTLKIVSKTLVLLNEKCFEFKPLDLIQATHQGLLF
jgi:hypothetical protein